MPWGPSGPVQVAANSKGVDDHSSLGTEFPSGTYDLRAKLGRRRPAVIIRPSTVRSMIMVEIQSVDTGDAV